MNTENNSPEPESAKSTPSNETAVSPPATTTPPTPTGPGHTPPRNPAGSGLSRPPKPGARRPGGASRPFPRSDKQQPQGDKPYSPGSAPPQQLIRDFAAHKPNNRELDTLIEDELNQAMAGFNVESTVADQESEQKSQASRSVPGQRRKRSHCWHPRQGCVHRSARRAKSGSASAAAIRG